MLSGKGCGISKTTRMLAQKQPYIKRVRNSSLVERSCAENVRGSNTTPKLRIHGDMSGRGASLCHGSGTGRGRGGIKRENAGMSSEMEVRILQAEYPRFPG